MLAMYDGMTGKDQVWSLWIKVCSPSEVGFEMERHATQKKEGIMRQKKKGKEKKEDGRPA